MLLNCIKSIHVKVLMHVYIVDTNTIYMLSLSNTNYATVKDHM